MSGLIDRIQSRTTTTDERTRVIEMADADADTVLDALSSDTGRTIFRTLFEEPGTASELAARLDTSVQNTHYHLTNLREAGLVEQIDTVYSEKGNEMTVYGPATDPLVFVGNEDRMPVVEQSLAQLVVGLGLLGVASLLVQWGAERLVVGGGHKSSPGGAVGPAGWDAVPDVADGTLGYLVFEVLEPGLLFFAGCLVAAALVAAVFGR
ncbi:ArsR/SmtB family transcription factor [Haloarchaeobius sp. DFWS5]|uniref:ArsR/SmtB family transcription factor n=1 Tax=Haloarchaeobius sp. DFWS5 TaxID=3446114 RepID=UPI003EB828D5